MKLKERPLDWWKGKKYTLWCRADKDDPRKIVYTLRGRENVRIFTSEDKVSFDTIADLRESRINSITLTDDVWYADLIVKS